MFPIFMINLDRSPRRLAFMQEQASRLGLSFTRISGVDGADNLPPEFSGQFPNSRMTSGEVGCYASHMLAWRAFADTGATFALILEDDAVLPGNITALIEETVRVLPMGWDYVKLSRQEFRKTRPLTQIDASHTLVRYSRVPSNTVAYLVSVSGAAKLLAPTLREQPVDTDLRRPWVFDLDLYGVAPPPVHDLQEFAPAFEARIKHSKMRRGLRALVHPFRNHRSFVWNVRKLGLWWWAYCLAANIALSAKARLSSHLVIVREALRPS